MKEWGRLVTAMVTPFHHNGQINYEKAATFARHLIDHGTSALVISGTTGESPTLKAEEKTELFETIKKNVTIPIIAGIGTNDTATSIENAKRAEKSGVDGLLAVVPYYNKPNQESIYAHFAAINDAVSLPIMLYNVPGRTGSNMTAMTATALSKLKNIVALKEASGDLVQLATVVRDCTAGFLVYTGEDSQILPTLAVGGYGVVSVASQIVGLQIASMIKYYLEGNITKAGEIHRTLLNINQKLFITSNPVPIKAALNLLHYDVGGTRLPLVTASEDLIEILKNELELLGLI